MKEFEDKLFQKLEDAKKVLFMGIGEEKMSDDGVGPYIIVELLEYPDSRFKFINAKIDPMARLDEIIDFHPSHLVLIDTCTLNEEPGTVSIIERENMADIVPISSHTIPIHIIIDLLIEKLPNLKVFMIGFVPETLEGYDTLTLYKQDEYSIEELNENIDLPFFDLNLSPIIKRAADKVIEIIKKTLAKI